MTKQSQQVLGFDFGTKRIGVASGQSLTSTTTELPPIKATDGTPNWQQLDRLFEEWRPDILVVGILRDHLGGLRVPHHDIRVRANMVGVVWS